MRTKAKELLSLNFGNLKIKYKFMLMYYPATLICIAILGITAYSSSVNIIQVQSLKIVTQAQEQVTKSVINKLETYELMLKNFAYNTEMQRVVIGNFTDRYDEMDAIQRMVSNIHAYIAASGRPANLAMIRINNDKFESIDSNFNKILDNLPDTSKYMYGEHFQLFNSSRIENRQWYIDRLQEKVPYIWRQIENDKSNEYYSLLSFMNSINSSKSKIGLLVLTVKIEDLLDVETFEQGDKQYYYMILNEMNDVLYEDNNDIKIISDKKQTILNYLDDAERLEPLQVGDYTIVKTYIPSNQWKVVSIVPMKTLMNPANAIGKTVIILCIISWIMLLAISFKLSDVFSKRILKICGKMKRFQEGITDTRINKTYDDELGYLEVAFNEMSEKTTQLIGEVFQANIDRKEAQLQALQAQINPHFLYNSLSSISRLGNKGRNHEVDDMVQALVTFYRMTLNKGKDIIPIADEIAQIKAYIRIYQIRMGELFNISYDIQESVIKYQTVKVILQPFVENVFEHAICDREMPIQIVLSIKEESDSIVFIIQDDGVGIPECKLKNILEIDNTESSSYGIKNVDKRLKLYYGNNYGVHIKSLEGSGTNVLINIPKVNM